MTSHGDKEPRKVVITKTDHGMSIRVVDSNPETRYQPLERAHTERAPAKSGERLIIKRNAT